uniref:FAD-binding FR-type domain-containing protein n=1 Tax=Odontella aurita TaxID=265563 RepID=A0A6U6I807_9STRA
MEIGNAFGMMAMIAFSFFLVPVTKHSPLLTMMDWDPIKAAVMHVWCGRTAILGVAVHGAMHMYRWAGLLGEDLLGVLVPPSGCWGSGLVPTTEHDEHELEHLDGDGHQSEPHEDEVDGGGHRYGIRFLHEGHDHGHDEHSYGCRRGLVSRLLRTLHEGHDHSDDHDHDHDDDNEACTAFQPSCVSPHTDCTCYHHFRNFTGLVALIFLLVILLSSLGPVRRKSFRLFYLIHMLSAPVVLIAAVMHYHRMVLYVSPSLLYYAACSIPNWVQAWFGRAKDGGVKIVSIREIPSATAGGETRQVVDLTLEATSEALRRYRPGQYLRVCVPSISSVWHPFTTNRVYVEGRPRGDKIRLLFRSYGPFTRSLAKELLQLGAQQSTMDDESSPSSRPPLLLADGFHGPTDRLSQALGHDVVIIVAGGIGITPYLSLLHELRSALARGVGNTRLLKLHWVCRDQKLIDFVRAEYLDVLLAAGCRGELGGGDCALRICIHGTDTDASNSYSDDPKTEPMPEVKAGGTDGEEGVGAWPSNPFKGEGANGSSPSSAAADLPAISLADGPGSPFAPSRFASASRDSIFGNLPYFVSFASIAWVGLAFVWYLYRRAIHRDDEVIPRIWGLGALALISLLVSLIANFITDSTDSVVWGIGRRGGVKVKFSPIAEDEPAEEVELFDTCKAKAATLEEGAALGQAALDAPSSLHIDGGGDSDSSQSSKGGVTVEMSRGRPDLYQLLDGMDGASSPALFLCGPMAMMKHIRSAARGGCFGCCPGNASVYEEAFEL